MANEAEKMSEEVAETARLYAMHHWRTVAPVLGTIILGLIWTVFMFDVWSPRADIVIWIIGNVLLFLLFVYLMEFLQRRGPGVAPEEVATLRRGWWKSLLSILTGILLFWGADELSLLLPVRYEALLLSLGFSLFILVDEWWDTPLRTVRWWQREPVERAGLVITIAFCGLVAAGVFDPFARLSEPWQEGMRWALPILVFLISSGIIGVLYSRVQFRRLQRLVREVPSEGGES